MQLIVGLGNPGAKYNFTRHNLGFLALDYYAKRKGLNWGKTPKFGGIYLKNGENILLKPQEFYNNSGEVVREYMRYFKIEARQILVVCDDFLLPLGKLRYRAHGISGGNNGLQSIIEALGTDNFPRLRIGSGDDEKRRLIGDVDFVLSKFTEEEKASLPEILEEVLRRIDEVA